MATRSNWFYDEMRHTGVDYSDVAQAEVYDRRHQKLRDYRKGAEAIRTALGLEPEHTVLDIGAGTGALALHAATFCKTVYAVDVSPAMLDLARRKAQDQGLANIVFCAGGFLSYEHQAPLVDAIVSVAVLHHLPDFWKLVALRRTIQMLKPGGRFYLLDVVFPGSFDDYAPRLDQWIEGIRRAAGPEFAAEAETHVRDEHSTYDWIMEGLLTRAGYRIDTAQREGLIVTYVCTRVVA